MENKLKKGHKKKSWTQIVLLEYEYCNNILGRCNIGEGITELLLVITGMEAGICVQNQDSYSSIMDAAENTE